MTIHFTLPYRTTYGDRLVVCGSLPALGRWNVADALPLSYDENTARWIGQLDVTAEVAAAPITYKYVLLTAGGGEVWEWGPNRPLPAAPAGLAHLEVRDYWRVPVQDDHELFTAAFTQALFRRPAHAPAAQVATAKVAKGKKKAEPVKSSFNTPANNRRLWEMSEQLTNTNFLD